jgi:large subunit ribosomal protein L24
MKKLKKNDSVIVISGKDRGRSGIIKKILESNGKVLVEGINLVKKHTKANPNSQIEGGIVQKEAAINISNIAIYNTLEKKYDRVGFRFLEDGMKKKRYFKSNSKYVTF